MNRCRDCRRFLVDGKCPNDCASFRKPAMRARGEERAIRIVTRREEWRATVIAIDHRRIPAPVPPLKGRAEGVGGEHENRMDRPFRVCPRCGSESYRPCRGRVPAECLQCGPIAFVGAM